MPPPSPTEDRPTSRDIVITAQGRRQVLQDVPLAVTAVGGEPMQNSGASDIRQLNQLAPSLLVSSTGTEANGSARIRGIGTVGDNPGLESSVAVFIDGVYRSRSGIGLNELGEVERIEVLRGPQGTLFGRNASAGLIHIITRRPEFGEFGGYAELTYGNYDQIRGAGAVNVPIGEQLAVRVDGGLCAPRRLLRVVNPTGGTESRVNDRDRFFVRGQLLFEPNDELSFRLIGDYTKRDESCCGAVYLDRGDQSADRQSQQPGDAAPRRRRDQPPTATTSSTCCATSASRWPGSAIPTAATSMSARAAPIRARPRTWAFRPRSTGISAERS